MLGGYNVSGSTAEAFCGHYGCYGTRGQYFQRQYTDILPHNMIYFSFTFNEVDSWDEDDTFQVIFDSMVITDGLSIYWENWYIKQNVCGNPGYPDQLGIRMFGKVPHSGSSLTLKFVMQNDEESSNESAGFRDIKLMFATISNATALNSSDLCGIPTTANYTTSVCECPEGFYTDELGICRACNSLCSSCFGASADQCYWYNNITQWKGGIANTPIIGTNTSSKQSLVINLDQKEVLEYFQFLAPARSIQYARYLDTYLPPRLEKLLEHPASNLFPINSQSLMPLTLRNHMTDYTMPTLLAKRNKYSNFLVNYWGETITFFSLVVFTLLLILFDKVQGSKKKSSGEALFHQALSIIKWNFPLVLIAFNIDYIILLASLQISSVHLSSTLDKVGLMFCLIFLLLCAILLTGVYYVIRTTSFLPFQAKGGDIKMKRTYSNTYVFYGGYRREGRLNRYFYLLYIIRVALPSIIACTLYSHPKVQTALYLIISVFMVSFVVHKRPLTKKINHVQLIIRELLNSLINLLLIIMVSLNTNTSKHLRAIEILGDMVIAANSLLHVVAIVFLALKVSIKFFIIWNLRKIENCLSNGAWMSFVAIYVQQAAFGFEEVLQGRNAFNNSSRYIYPDISACAVMTKDLKYAPSASQVKVEAFKESQDAINDVNMQISEEEDHKVKQSPHPDLPLPLYPDFSQPLGQYYQEPRSQKTEVRELEQVIKGQSLVIAIDPVSVKVAENSLTQKAKSGHKPVIESSDDKFFIGIVKIQKENWVYKS